MRFAVKDEVCVKVRLRTFFLVLDDYLIKQQCLRKTDTPAPHLVIFITTFPCKISQLLAKYLRTDAQALQTPGPPEATHLCVMIRCCLLFCDSTY